jgi:lysozyme
MGQTITKEQAVEFMKADLLQVWKNLQPLVKVELTPNQWAALVSFSGNVKWKSVKSSSVISCINSGRLAEVPGRMALYRLGAGKVMNGLVRRRAAEGALWMKASAAEVKVDKEEARGTVATPASTKKPWDWGIFGVLITTLAGLSDEVKKLIGDLTSAFGVSPLVILAIIVGGFAAYTLYTKWKGDK